MDVAGFILYAVLLCVAFLAVARAAARRGLLAPVLVGVGARLILVLVVHAVSVHNGRGGSLYLDDSGFMQVGWRIAQAWRDGHAVEAASSGIVGAFGGPLYYDFVGTILFLAGPSMLAVKLASPVFGGLTILLAGILMAKTIGAKAARPGAWAVALMPTVVWWSAPMLKEPIVAPLVVATLVAAANLPRGHAVVRTTLLLIATAGFRLSFALALAVALVPWFLFASVRQYGVSPRRLVGAAVGAGVVLLIVAVLVPTAGHPARAPDVYMDTLTSFRSAYGGSIESDLGRLLYASLGPFHLVVGMVRMLVSPRPWALTQVPFDWYQPLFIGMWFWYALWPSLLVGLWRLRRTPLAYLLVSVVVLGTAIYALTGASGARQRSSLEPLLLVFVVAGVTGLRSILVFAGFGFLVISPLVAFDLRDPSPGFALAALAISLLGASRLTRHSQERRRRMSIPEPERGTELGIEMKSLSREPSQVSGPHRLLRSSVLRLRRGD